MKNLRFVLFFLIFTCQYSFAQDLAGIREIHASFNQNQIDSLHANFAGNKSMIPAFELPTLIALSYYPELKATRVIFVERSIRTTGASFPKWTFLFQRRKHRIYKIYINNDPRRLKGAILNDVPFNGQIGLFGHELGHIADYSKMGTLRIIALGIKYMFVSGRVAVEKRVDNITIAHHLGWQLYDFDDFIMNRSKVSNAYKDYKRRVYYTPKELLQLMGEINNVPINNVPINN